MKKVRKTVVVSNNEQKNILYSLDSLLIICFLLANLLDYLVLGSRFIDYNQLFIIFLKFVILIGVRIVLSILFLRNKETKISNFILFFFIAILSFILIILYLNLLEQTPDNITNVLTIYWLIILVINYLMRR